MDGAITSHRNDLVVVMDACLSRQLDGVTGIHRPGPLDAAMLFGDRTQVTRDTPGVAHICHGVQNDFDFTLHNGFSIKSHPARYLVEYPALAGRREGSLTLS